MKTSRYLLLGVSAALLILLLLSMWFFVDPLRLQTIDENTKVNATASVDPALQVQLTAKALPQDEAKKMAHSGTDRYLPPPHVTSSFIGAMRSPIEFYGQVIDQNGTPIENASVLIEANNVAWGRGEKHELKSDAKGHFSIKGIHGLSAFIKVSKKDYYPMPVKTGQIGSQASFAYGSDLGDGIHRPNSSKPVVFKLYKIGQIEPLIHRKRRSWNISKDGVILRLPLEPRNEKPHYIEVQCWSDDAEKNDVRHHNWRFKVSVPDGGLLRRYDPLDFEAPLATYTNSEEFNMPSSMPTTDWRDEISADYFVRFNDGIFGRFQIEMSASGSHQVRLEAHLNPKVGSRNLTANPDKHY